MKFFITLLSFFFVSGCTSFNSEMPKTESEIIEYALLWKNSENKKWPPNNLIKMVRNDNDFTRERNFCKINRELYVFGHKAPYLGLLGVNDFGGPNVTLEGKPKDVAKYIRYLWVAVYRI